MKTPAALWIALAALLVQGVAACVDERVPRWWFPCPAIKCIDPCAGCGGYSTASSEGLAATSCITAPTYFYHYGRYCPGCPELVSCGDNGDGGQCGPVTCPSGKECCNASCGTCVDPGMSCTQQACDNFVRRRLVRQQENLC